MKTSLTDRIRIYKKMLILIEKPDQHYILHKRFGLCFLLPQLYLYDMKIHELYELNLFEPIEKYYDHRDCAYWIEPGTEYGWKIRKELIIWALSIAEYELKAENKRKRSNRKKDSK